MNAYKPEYQDELLVYNKPAVIQTLSDLKNKDGEDPSLDLVLHNTIRIDIHLPYIEAELTEQGVDRMCKEILSKIGDTLPDSYEMETVTKHKKTKMLARYTVVKCFD